MYDFIHSGNGGDKITGGDGDDKLDGGGYGNDQFIFNNGFDSDIILNFEYGKDKIDLSSYTKTGNTKIAFDDLKVEKSGGDIKITSDDFIF